MIKKINLKNAMKIDKGLPKLKMGVNSMQQTLPIYAVHEKENLIEVEEGYFTKSYYLQDINYTTLSEKEQEDTLDAWRDTYNSLGNINIAITVFNKTVNLEKVIENATLKEQGDELDLLRRDLNTVNIDRIKNGRNGIRQSNIITLGIKAKDVNDAAIQFKRLDGEEFDNPSKETTSNGELNKSLSRLGSRAYSVPLEEKLEMLFDICNYGHEGEFITKSRMVDSDGNITEVESFDLNNIRSMGLTVNDVVGAASFNVYDGYIELGDKYACVMQISRYSNRLKDTFFHSIADQDFNLITTLNVQPMPQDEAKRLLNVQLQLCRERIEELKKINRNNQVSEDALPPSVLDREQEILDMISDLSKNDERLYSTSVSILLFADTLEELKDHIEVIKTTGRKSSMGITVIRNLQEEGFLTALPFAYDLSLEKRTFKTTTVALLVPFSNMELNDENGIVYSQNAITKQLVIYDRLSPKNLSYNGFILGIPGSGKSYTAKLEQIQFRLKGNSVLIIDPEGEYGRTAKLLGGSVVKIAPGSNSCINPLDIYVDENDNEMDPVLEKADFILQLCECIMHSPFGLNSVQKVIIDECVHDLYAPFYDKNHILHQPSKEDTPTLTDLQIKLASRKEPEAREIAYALKLYSTGSSLGMFGGHTNVDIDNDYVVFDILKLGDTAKPVAMLILVNTIWQKVLRNKKLGRFTYLGIDEFHLLLQDEQTALAIQGFWKRFRKFGGVPVGLTQNVSDLMASPIGSKMLANSTFVFLLNQQADDRELVRETFRLSDSMLKYITNSPKGQGLLLNPSNGTCIPCYGPFPKDTLINKAITSDMRELKQYAEEDRKKQKEYEKIKKE